MIYLLPAILAIETLCIYMISKDVLNSSFVFAAVFFISSVNLMTNVSTVGVSLHFLTGLYIAIGCFAFFCGSVITGKLRIKHSKISILHLKRRNQFNTNVLFLTFVLVFNVVSIAYVLREVYHLAQVYAYYRGALLGSLSVFAEVQKFGTIDLRVGTMSTFLTAFLEAEAYVTGYILVSCLVHKEKMNFLLLLCFITSFMSTFCQGSRGGVFILIALVFIYVMLDRKKRHTKRIQSKIIKKAIIGVVIGFVAFQVSGEITGKMWDVSWYEYLSVYLGFPIYNLDVAMTNGIPRADITGAASFGGLYSNLLPRLGFDFQSYTAYNGSSGFQNLNGHNMGNVYTIYKDLIADFGYIGAIIALVIVGAIMQLLYNRAINDDSKISVTQIIYAYFLSCTAFSFFSNKICEAVTVFHIFEFIFLYVWILLLTKKPGLSRARKHNKSQVGVTGINLLRNSV